MKSVKDEASLAMPLPISRQSDTDTVPGCLPSVPEWASRAPTSPTRGDFGAAVGLASAGTRHLCGLSSANGSLVTTDSLLLQRLSLVGAVAYEVHSASASIN